ncbi:efflux transporter outer membrane subunit [Fluoribacter dumoffii]|nr:efflux transporter outer membrane subunit [Fluoribacter dumoffii]
MTWSLIITCLLSSSCTVGPNYVKPSMVIPAHYKEARKGWKVATPQDENIQGEWWTIFHDAELDALELLLNNANQTIIAAEANYRRACWLVNQARANYFPTVSGVASIIRQTTLPTLFPPHFKFTETGTTDTLLLNSAWEPDIWGGVRRLVESKTAGAKANAALLAATRLSAQASLAQFYFELRTIDEDQALLDATVVNYQQALQIVKESFNSGHAAYSDVAQAQSQLETAKAQATHNGINRAKYEHAIAILIGKPPAYFSFKAKHLPLTPPRIPIQIPSALLERRPDVAQAERQVAQANAQIGIAISAYFPTLLLSASGGFQTNGFATLLSAPTKSWAIGARLAETIFDAGYRKATKQAAYANYEATVASYRQTVLVAFQEVEDNLAALNILQSEATQQKQAEISARLALKLVMDGYKAGTNTYSDVILAQTNAYSAEKATIDVYGLRMTAAVGLIKALGGGWEVHSIDK